MTYRPANFTIKELVDPWFLANYSEDECWAMLDELEGPLMDEPQPYLGWCRNVHFVCKNKDRCIPKTELHYTIHRDVLSKPTTTNQTRAT